MLAPRLPVPDEFGLCRYLAAGLAALQSVDPKLGVDLAALADGLDAEALRNSAGREVFTNPAKALVERMSRRRVVLAGDCAATLALARHGSSVLLRIAHQVAAATGLADALAALRAAADSGSVDPVEALFHDEEIDGPVAERLRVLALALDAEHSVWRLGSLSLTTSTSSAPRMCRRGRVSAQRRSAPNGSSSNWVYWLSGWRWQRFICGWCGDR